MKRYRYNTMPVDGNISARLQLFVTTANIVIEMNMRAASIEEASEQFESHLNEYHEGFEFQITVEEEKE